MQGEYTGKKVGGGVYLHVAALPGCTVATRSLVHRAEEIAHCHRERDFNVVKIPGRNNKLSLLSYKNFFGDPFPVLMEAFTVDLNSNTARHTSYCASANPPILHRKELLLPPDHARVPEFRALTNAIEKAGLYRAAHRIGFQRQWYDRLREYGFAVEEHRLVRLKETSGRNDGPG